MEICKLFSAGGIAGPTTRVVMPNGEAMPGVVSVAVPEFKHGDRVVILVELRAEVEVEGQPLLSREAIAAQADRYGLKLVPKTLDDLTAADHHRVLDRLEDVRPAALAGLKP